MRRRDGPRRSSPDIYVSVSVPSPTGQEGRERALLTPLLPVYSAFVTAARLLGWRTGEPDILCASTLRTLVRDHGGRIRRLEQTEVIVLLSPHTTGRRLVGVPVEQPRRRAGWPEELGAAVAAALAQGQARPPEGGSRIDGERVLAARAEDASTPLATLRRLGPAVAPGQMLLVLDEVLTRAPEHGQFHELRTACLLTTDTRRYLSGRGIAFLPTAGAGRRFHLR